MPKIIRQLSSVTRSRLRSTQILTSIPQIVSELVQNSIDAEASHIDIGIDCAQWTCWVRDDGVGIPVEDLRQMSKAADSARYRWRTSKMHPSGESSIMSMFGFRGEALASAAEIACLEISSRTAEENETWSVIFKGSCQIMS
ncbi:histidine kinase-like ATPase [Cantharellus anzutake]|uniref:histidine kinase-like ATPase n=1 Tax=Cantharellus anzutake TaxID=1750568 RepID=UPI0019074FD1|nr:histidine kinase-like ATPase [Cantharellus anzutake]KAF8341391.1 histidine kinase-like ATPase [Cantharellus anzutake]